jgi:cell division protein FtsB
MSDWGLSPDEVEIRDLRAEVERLQHDLDSYMKAANEYLAEVERLRHELSEDGVTARRRMHDDVEILRAEVERLRAENK